MDITREVLLEKRRACEDAYMQALATANANHGAMQMLDELIAIQDTDEAVKDANSTSSDSN